MRSIRVLCVCVLLLLSSSTALAKFSVECRGDTLTINLDPGDPGKALRASDFVNVMTPAFKAQLDSVNAFKRRLVVEVSNDPTLWKFWGFINQDPKYQGLDFEALNLVFDGALNYARRQTTVNQVLGWIGVTQDALLADRPVRRKTCFIKLYAADLLPYQQPQRVIERVVEQTAPDTTTIYYQYHVDSGWQLGLQAGVTKTVYNFAPTATISLFYYQRLMVQAYGIHSLFIRKDRDVFDGHYPTFDTGGGVLFGARLYDPIWLVGGYFNQENILDDTSQAGRNVTWWRGAELGFQLIQPHYALSLTGIYGHRKDLDRDLETDFGVRAAVTVGHTWGWK